MSGNINFDGWINDDGSENYKCRAWVNFNGTGTVAIRASGNVSSITDTGTGEYAVNFTTAMPDANYCVNGTSSDTPTLNTVMAVQHNAITTTSVRVVTFATPDNTVRDRVAQFVSVFR